MFRDFCQRKALRFGITGWVRNVSDGTVEVVAWGERGVLERFLEKIHRGSILSRVDGVVVHWGEGTSTSKDFEIRY